MNHNFDNCPILDSKNMTARKMIDLSIKQINENATSKMNLIWLEATGCSGNIISLLNAENPDTIYFINNMVTLTYNNSIMADEGEVAFQRFVDTLDTDFILAVEGAVSMKDNGSYNYIASYNGRRITALEAVRMAAEKARYIVAVGTCASYGGVSAANPNPAQCASVSSVTDKEVIRVPGCPCHPDWVIGTIAHLLAFGRPELDTLNRPIVFYGITIHDQCTRRSFFDNGIFASKLGDRECMFKLGCRGPVTRTDCPKRQWNSYVNWPVKDNTPCIGCAAERFPDGMEPFVRY
ncbi:MAG TPA: hydrogenase small subunit [Lachnospiraceae bacterium]|nr:hydrogenase small subunit [Lachnospiraceae bacterium]